MRDAIEVTDTAQSAGSCPVDHAHLSQQRTSRVTEPKGGPLEQDTQGVWHVRDYHIARTILRGNTRQAGFKAELLDRMGSYMNKPVLYLEGDAHREQRRATARFFTPRTTREYEELMARYAEQILEDFQRAGRADLSNLTLRMAVQVAAKVIGLTDSVLPGMDRRLANFLQQSADASPWRPRRLLGSLANQWQLGQFFLLDVLPAIRARRKAPQEDVISHLIESGYQDSEILTECVTYGAAGMATTREFICVAAWHLLEQPELRAWFLASDEEARYAFLNETLRLEPVIGHLYRRLEEELVVEHAGEQLVIPSGSLIDLHIYAINADEAVVGEDALQLCLMREMVEPRVPAYVMGFGDGHHRCPGAYIAIQETDLFLRRLLSLPNLRVAGWPSVTWNETVSGYELRNFMIEVDTL